jgi:type II secretory pathway pseudopilin PulG
MSKQSGITFIELVMVLFIASSILLLGITQFQSMSQDQDRSRITATVDILFQGLANYYRANCRVQRDASSNPVAGTGVLDPVNSPTSPKVLAINSFLRANTFISQWPPQNNNLVDTTAGEYGFIVQLNKLTPSTTRGPTAIYNNWTPGASPSAPYSISLNQPAGIQTLATATVWTVQVAVKLASGLDPATYKTLLRADCLSSVSGGAVTPCSSLPGGGDYLVWERLPSNATTQATSKVAPSMFRLKEFTNLYNNDDMYGATNKTWGASSNNYLCGG